MDISPLPGIWLVKTFLHSESCFVPLMVSFAIQIFKTIPYFFFCQIQCIWAYVEVFDAFGVLCRVIKYGSICIIFYKYYPDWPVLVVKNAIFSQCVFLVSLSKFRCPQVCRPMPVSSILFYSSTHLVPCQHCAVFIIVAL